MIALPTRLSTLVAISIAIFIIYDSLIAQKPGDTAWLFPDQYPNKKSIIEGRKPSTFLDLNSKGYPFVVIVNTLGSGHVISLYGIYVPVGKKGAFRLVHFRRTNSFNVKFSVSKNMLDVKDAKGQTIETINLDSLSLASKDYVWGGRQTRSVEK